MVGEFVEFIIQMKNPLLLFRSLLLCRLVELVALMNILVSHLLQNLVVCCSSVQMPQAANSLTIRPSVSSGMTSPFDGGSKGYRNPGFVKKVGSTPDGDVLYGDFRPNSDFFNKARNPGFVEKVGWRADFLNRARFL